MIITAISIILGSCVLWIWIGVIAGTIYDKQNNIHKVHNKFMLLGFLSFSRNIRRNYICDKCF